MTSITSQEQALKLSQIKANNNTATQTTAENTKESEPVIKDGDKKSIDKLKWAGIIAAGALAAAGVVVIAKKGKISPLEIIKDDKGQITRKINGKVLTFKNGSAMLDDNIAKGTLKFSTKEGVVLTYKDGILQNAVKKGENGFLKNYKNGKLLEAKINTGKGTDTIAHIYNEQGKLTKITKNGIDDVIFKYNENGKVSEIKKGEVNLLEKIKNNISNTSKAEEKAAQTIQETSVAEKNRCNRKSRRCNKSTKTKNFKKK